MAKKLLPVSMFALMLCCLSVYAQRKDSTTTFHLYLIGDAGEPTVGQVTYRQAIQRSFQQSAEPAAVVFLGDNVYPKGMPAIGSPGRQRAESILKSQIELVNGVNGPIYFIPGNHDWKRGRPAGWVYIQHEQQWIDSLNDPRIIFLPKAGCPGPEEIHLSQQLVLIIIDSEWILHPWTKPEGENSLCETKTAGDLLVQLEDMLRRNRGKQVVVVAHHPVYTYGEHGGVFTLKEHLFPLTDADKHVYLPLPVLGSIYPFYRKIFGSIQDVAHPVYKQFVSGLALLLKQFPGTIYASGHEHALEYSMVDSVHYVVSGAGVKTSPVRKKGFAQFASALTGFVELRVNGDGSGTIDYHHADDIVFSRQLVAARPRRQQVVPLSMTNDSVVAKASPRYMASKRHQRWLGENYRKEWSQDIKVPVFDIGKEKGGLKIVQRGGGMQTLSLRLQDSLGHEFTLRSIEKFPEKAVPAAFRKTFAQDLVQDQISAAHPYGALVVPFLAQPVGIYHTNPSVVFLPDDPRFGVYQKDFANQLMLFEERPSGSGKDMPFFGSPDKIISTDKVLEKLADDNDNRVDEEFVLRSRVFDLWIGDWDRHDDQWRWGQWDNKKGKIYRPIPRDRDQAFFVNEGRIPKLWSKPWLLPKFEGFDDKVKWPSGLMFNGRYFDRSFLTGLSRQQWEEAADAVISKMTDEIIESAIKKWPPEIFQWHGDEIIHRLKSRRNALKGYAMDHYLFLAKEVDITGSNQDELFEIENQDNGTLRIQVFKNKNNEKGKKIYEREFIPDETKEVRLYGLGGDDRFVVKGQGSKVKVRIIGGDGNDVLDAIAKGGKTSAYDLKKGLTAMGSNFRDLRSADPAVNEYNRKAFAYDVCAPLLYGNYNVDDGLFLGGGVLINTHGFRKAPFKARHFLLGSVALRTGSFNFKYDGRFSNVMGKWNFEIDADVKSPNYVNNFFGWGNESLYNKEIVNQPGLRLDNSIEYYRVRFREYALELKLARTFGQGGFLKIGPAFQYISIVKPQEDRYIKTYVSTLGQPVFANGSNFAGLTYLWGFDNRNSPLLTTRGVFFQQSSRWMKGIDSHSPDFASHKASLALYQSFKFPAKVTFAFRAGGGLNNGSYEFYQAQILDGKTELRGFRKTRFYGDSKLYFNNEMRIKLANVRSYLVPATVGLTLFYDVGRVWYKDTTGIDPSAPSGNSNVWHQGYGGGVWFTPFNLSVVSTEIGHSVEGTLFYIRLGFLF